ncbi:MAG: NADH dehydrogenase subunit [Clostridiales bacterium]|nr:NADH dehydrogenase subunit [Clostridiales bacterium]
MGENNRIVIPLGPQHPALKEPGCFTLTLEGEKVVSAVVGVGYIHRGLEKALESRTYIQNLYMIERICGICSHTHSVAYCQAIEEMCSVEIPMRAKYIRVIIAELERLHSHLLWLGVAAHEIGFDTLFMYSWRDREMVLDMLAELCGNRVNYGINTLGGVRRDIDSIEATDIKKMLRLLQNQINYYLELASNEPTLIVRLANVGRLNHEDAIKYGAVGPVARAAGIANDIRVIEPYAAYDEVPVNVVVDDHGDVFGRTVVRIKEMLESINIVKYCLENLPEGEIVKKVPRKVPAGEIISRTEAPRGEDIHYINSDGSDIPYRIRVRAPSEANWHGMQHMLEGSFLADVPITIAAIDPCYSCTDRAIIANSGNGESKLFDWKGLREYSINWHRERGFNASDIQIPQAKNYTQIQRKKNA